MNSARSILTKEIWSRRTDKRILLSVVRMFVTLGVLFLIFWVYAFVSARWLTPSGRKKAQDFLKQSETVRFGNIEDVKRAKGGLDLGTLDYFTFANRLVEVRAQFLVMDAGMCRTLELSLPKIQAGASRDRLERYNQQRCEQYEQDVKSLRESLKNAPAFQFRERQDLWQRTLAK